LAELERLDKVIKECADDMPKLKKTNITNQVREAVPQAGTTSLFYLLLLCFTVSIHRFHYPFAGDYNINAAYTQGNVLFGRDAKFGISTVDQLILQIVDA
jgi:hypothetical protein